MSTANLDPAAPVQTRRRWAQLVPEKGPRRVLVAVQLINLLGNGMFLTGQALFFTRSVGLPVAEVGLGLGISAFVGLLAGLPVGRLADKKGSREAYVVSLALEGLAAASLIFVHAFWSFLVLVCLTQLAESASRAARGPILREYGGEHPAQFRAYLRSLSNVAVTGGAGIATFAILIGTRPAYVALVLGNAATFFVCSALMLLVPHVAPKVVPSQAMGWTVLRDKPFAALTVHEGLLATQGCIITFVLPLWIVDHTDAPHWTIGLGLIINTVLCATTQIRASKRVETPSQAGRALRRAGVAFLLAAILLAAMAGPPGWIAVVLLVPGIVIHTIGETWQTAAGFELSFALAPAHSQGQYSAMYNIGAGLASALGPPMLALLCISWGKPGWFVAGGIFAVLGLLGPPLVSWAERTR